MTRSSNSNKMLHFLRCQEVSVDSQYNKCPCNLASKTSRTSMSISKEISMSTGPKKKFITLFRAVEVTYCYLCTLKSVLVVDSCESGVIPITTYYLNKKWKKLWIFLSPALLKKFTWLFNTKARTNFHCKTNK